MQSSSQDIITQCLTYIQKQIISVLTRSRSTSSSLTRYRRQKHQRPGSNHTIPASSEQRAHSPCSERQPYSSDLGKGCLIVKEKVRVAEVSKCTMQRPSSCRTQQKFGPEEEEDRF
eukprot:6212017-Pleurochrysis_carterae.AAC.3